LVRSPDPAATAAATAALERRARAIATVAAVRGPADAPELSRAGGRSALVQVTLRGDPDDAGEHVAPLTDAVAAVAAAHPDARLHQTGVGTFDEAIGEVVEDDLRKAELISLPIALVILFLAFGALVAAAVPVFLGLTSVIAAFGGLGLISQVAPVDEATTSLVVLLGLAVGVDYSLFYVRREREERRAGRGERAALDATAATVGRAVVVSGLTVMVALSGLLITGMPVFTSMALGTMLVVAIAVVGSLTALPATLALLGDRIDRGRLPFMGRGRKRGGLGDRAGSHAGAAVPGQAARVAGGAWGRLARATTRRPAVWLTIAACLLGSLAVSALALDTSESGIGLHEDERVMVDLRAVERAFPGTPAGADLVVTGARLDGPGTAARLRALGERGRAATGGSGPVDVELSRDGRTARVAVPLPETDPASEERLVQRLRADVAPTAAAVAPGAAALVTGNAASAVDFSDRLTDSTPLVIAFVLVLALVLMLASFRSLPLAAAVMGLNLLSVGAAYGVLVAVFQHDWAEGLLGFTSNGTVAAWVPLNAFVILFGLSMDYTILVLERMREARAAGRSPRAAAAESVGATASTITSAAVVMVAIFMTFAVLPLAEMKMIGLTLAAGVLIDATLVRGIALPATVALLGERGIRAPRGTRRRARTRPAPAAPTATAARDAAAAPRWEWDHGPAAPPTAPEADASR
ncbi:MAG: MMPL family transporter, partial [Solirubrobacterales bacterium]|nr:MMPL family transporter [Solirubrobacterales bacterium]